MYAVEKRRTPHYATCTSQATSINYDRLYPTFWRITDIWAAFRPVRRIKKKYHVVRGIFIVMIPSKPIQDSGITFHFRLAPSFFFSPHNAADYHFNKLYRALTSYHNYYTNIHSSHHTITPLIHLSSFDV
jgi:hypothetical protein